jgi:predicted ATPase/class 3 adenylate cyclase
MMAELPRGTVTFLFTDIEGSTRLWERDRSAMASAVDRHLALLDHAIVSRNGVHFKTVGDAVQAAFPTAPDAVAAALAAQTALLNEEWSTSDPFRVRMALHAGEAIPDDRGDYLAAPLNRLARLLAIGHGGQVLLSQAVQQLVRDSLPPDAGLKDLGGHRLQDLLEPEQVFQLLHPDLPADIPPLKSLGARPNNLPLQPTPFLGREDEVREVGNLLRSPDVRLLTLTGPGGSGKTRLGLQVAADCLDAFADGVFFVALAPLTNPDLVPSAIAAALGVREAGGRPLTDQLREYLAAKSLLLVLDNVEHLIEAAPLVADLLGAAPALKVLATSRVPLHLRAEHEYAVPTLDLPPRKPPPTVQQLTQYDAVRLFIARAQAVKPGFAVDNETAPAIAEICWRLDGLPLAIELAAARIRMLPPLALLARLEKRLPLLTGGARDAPQRQRTLRDTIAWSYDLLEPEEQTLFRRLAVFAGGCTLEAAEMVATLDGERDIFGGLEGLVEHSLLRQDEQPDGEPRFLMLETVREFGLEHLDDRREAEAVASRHADYFTTWVETADLEVRGPHQVEWLRQMDVEQDNLRTALGWTLRHDPEMALRLASAQHWYWFLRGQVREGRTWLERALAASSNAEERRIMALNWASFLAWNQSDLGVARARAEEALSLATTHGDERGRGWALLNLGAVTRQTGSHERASELSGQARDVFREQGERWGGAIAAYGIGMGARATGRINEARRLFEQALVEVETIEDRAFGCFVRAVLGGAAFVQGDLDEARALIEAAQADAKALGFRLVEARALHQLGVIAVAQGNFDHATDLLTRAETDYRDVGSWIDIAFCRNDLGYIRLSQGNTDVAMALFEDAMAIARERGDQIAIALMQVSLGDALSVQGNIAGAAEMFRDGLTAAQKLADERTIAGCLRGLASVALVDGRVAQAVRLLAAEDASRAPNRLHIFGYAAERREHDLDTARSALGQDPFASAWDQGTVLQVDEAVAEALGMAMELAAEASA